METFSANNIELEASRRVRKDPAEDSISVARLTGIYGAYI